MQRQRRSAEVAGHPQSVAFACPRPPHRPVNGAEYTHIYRVPLRARQVTAENARLDVIGHRRNPGHDISGRVGAFRISPIRHAQGHHEPEWRRAIGREIRQRGTGGAESDLLEIEPLGAEVDALEGRVDADRQRPRAERNDGAIIAQLRFVAGDLRDALHHRADAIELFAGAEVH